MARKQLLDGLAASRPLSGHQSGRAVYVVDNFDKDLIAGHSTPGSDQPLESPRAKQLRVEQERRKQIPSKSLVSIAGITQNGTNRFSRPKSKGNDESDYKFPKPHLPPKKLSSVDPPKTGFASFAPQNYILGRGAIQSVEARDTGDHRMNAEGINCDHRLDDDISSRTVPRKSPIPEAPHNVTDE